MIGEMKYKNYFMFALYQNNSKMECVLYDGFMGFEKCSFHENDPTIKDQVAEITDLLINRDDGDGIPFKDGYIVKICDSHSDYKDFINNQLFFLNQGIQNYIFDIFEDFIMSTWRYLLKLKGAPSDLVTLIADIDEKLTNYSIPDKVREIYNLLDGKENQDLHWELHKLRDQLFQIGFESKIFTFSMDLYESISNIYLYESVFNYIVEYGDEMDLDPHFPEE